MAVKSFRVEAKSKGRITVRVRAEIIVEPGTLTSYELSSMKSNLASGLMHTLSGTRYLNVEISDMKVTR